MSDRSFIRVLPSALIALIPSAAASAQATQGKPVVPEAPSTVKAVYVDPSATRELQPGEKIGQLYTRNHQQPYVLQRLSKRTYWFQRQYYSTIFYVGDEGVLLFDPLDGREDFLRQAIAEVTKLPVTALVYSHFHADHIGSAPGFVDAAEKAGRKLRVFASKATVDKMEFLKSALPRPTEGVDWPRGVFHFEALAVQFHGFERAAHTDDAGAWVLTEEKVVHAPDLVNPDQLPFWSFAGSENFVYYETNLKQLQELEWAHLSGGHGNVGAKADIDFYLLFLGDLKVAVAAAMKEVTYGAGIDPTKINAHTAYLTNWTSSVSRKAVEALRPKYGPYYGFEFATIRNSEMVALAMLSYR